MDYEKKYKEAVIKMRLFFKKYNGLVISEDGKMYKDLLEIFPDIARLENGQLMEFLADFAKEEPISDELDTAAKKGERLGDGEKLF